MRILIAILCALVVLGPVAACYGGNQQNPKGSAAPSY